MEMRTQKYFPVSCAARSARKKAALKQPHSKRLALHKAHNLARQRLECGRFSAAFRRSHLPGVPRPVAEIFRANVKP